MTLVESLARWTAIAIAAASVLDPSVPIPRREPRVVRVFGGRPADVDHVATALSSAGFTFDSSRREDATVWVTDGTERIPPGAPNTWIVDTAAVAPNVRLAHASVNTSRLPGQALEVSVVLTGEGVDGQTTEVVLEDAGVPVAAARHQWKEPRERWDARLQYLPPATAAGRLRVRATPVDGESSAGDNAADVGIRPARGPARVLVVETAVTWPALFVRRALEGESAFTVTARQRASSSVSTSAGTAPAALTRDALQPFEAVVLGGASLSSSDRQALEWFVDVRGGILVLVPDREPTAAYASLVGVTAFDARTVDAPLRLTSGLFASELAIPRPVPPLADVIAADPEGRPVVFSVRRGAGAILFSGALDAWRHRGRDDDAYARFWRNAIATSVLTVPPALDVTLAPAIARPGQPIRVVARLRETELSPGADRVEVRAIEGRAIAPSAKVDDPIRLWPTAEPGVFEGEWWPGPAGVYDIRVSAAAVSADATLTVANDIVLPAAHDSEDLALIARASGGESHRVAQLDAFVAAMEAAYPSQRVTRPGHIMRASWWPVPFALLLCGEWALRRKRGLA